MINKKEIDAYRSIKAPDSLRQRVLSEDKEKNKRISSTVRMCYALAATLLVLVVVFAFLPDAETSLYYADTIVDNEAIVLMPTSNRARIAPVSIVETQELPLYFEADKKTTVTVSDGELILVGKNKRESVGQSITFNSDTELLWLTDLSITAPHTLKLKTGSKTSSYCISQNKENQWVFTKK